MKRNDAFYALLLWVGILFSCWTDCYGIVYVNRVLKPTDNDPCAYDLSKNRIQSNEVWDANYQNAYGECIGLDPGPPFIVETTLFVTGGDLTVQGGTMSTVWQIQVDSNRTFKIIGTELQLGPSVNVLVSNDGVFEAEGATIIGAQLGGQISVNFGGYCTLKNSELITPTTNFLNAFAPGNIIIENCKFNCLGATVAGPTIGVSADPRMKDFILKDSEFKTNADLQNYVELASMPKAIITGNTFTEAFGFGVRLGNIADLTVDNNHFEEIQCPGGVINTCEPLLINNSGIRSVRGNTGVGCTYSGIRMAFAGAISAAGTAKLKSEKGFPFVLNTAMIIEGRDSIIFEPGTVMKLGGLDNMIIRGHMEATNVILTSERDNSIEGNTTQLFEPAPGDWRGFMIDGQTGFTASANLKNCTFRFGTITISRNPNAWLEMDNCVVEWSINTAVQLQDASETARNTRASITNSTFRYNKTGFSDFQLFENHPTLFVGNKVIANERGLHIKSNNNFYAERNFVAGNRVDGLFFDGSTSPFFVNNFFVANGHDGMHFGFGSGGDEIHILNNYALGNRMHGVSIQNWGAHLMPLSNNLLAYNQGYGFAEFSSFIADHPIRNNIFWENKTGASYENNLTEMTPETQNEEPGSANNLSLDPQLVVMDTGEVITAWQNTDIYRTTLLHSDTSHPTNAFKNMLLWNQENDHFFLILRNDTTFLIEGNDTTKVGRLVLSDTTSFIRSGTPFSIVKIDTFPSPSPLANLGSTISVLPNIDYFGLKRVQLDTVDVGPMESQNFMTTSTQIEWIDENWSIYPNPANHEIFIRLDFPVSPDVQLKIFDSKGHLVKQQPWEERISLNELTQGIYWVVLRNGKDWYRKSIIIIK